MKINGTLKHFRVWAISTAAAKTYLAQTAPYEGLAEFVFDVEDEPCVEVFAPTAAKECQLECDSGQTLDFRKLGPNGEPTTISPPNGLYIVSLLTEDGLFGELECPHQKINPADWTCQKLALGLVTGRPDDDVATKIFRCAEEVIIDQENLLTSTISTEFGLLEVAARSQKWLLPLEEIAHETEDEIEDPLTGILS